MNGNIIGLYINDRGQRTYGFILGEDHQDYFFYKNDLINCSMAQIQEGDSVEFVPMPSQRKPGKMVAANIRKRTTSASTAPQYANPGIHRDVELGKFNQNEQTIIQLLSKALYVTNGGRELIVSSCCYRYVLIKPTEDYVVNFNLKREIPVIFSDYEVLEPRSLDVAAHVAKDIPSALRLDRSCQIMVSRDSNVEEKLGELLRDSNLSSVVIPFSYSEFVSGEMIPARILDRFRKYLFDADLFTTSQPIENDVFFFWTPRLRLGHRYKMQEFILSLRRFWTTTQRKDLHVTCYQTATGKRWMSGGIHPLPGKTGHLGLERCSVSGD